MDELETKVPAVLATKLLETLVRKWDRATADALCELNVPHAIVRWASPSVGENDDAVDDYNESGLARCARSVESAQRSASIRRENVRRIDRQSARLSLRRLGSPESDDRRYSSKMRK